MAYGKALSTYKRINKIKRSSEKISQAQNMIGEQRAKSIDEARKLQRRNEIVGAVSNAAQVAASYGMAQSDNIDPETASLISTGMGGAAEIGESLFTPMNQEEFLGLSTEEYRNIHEQVRPDVAGGAISGYSLQESLNEIRRRKDYDDANLEDNVYGYDDEQMAPYMNEVGFEKGVGYDFSKLPRITREKLRNIAVQRGIEKDPFEVTRQESDEFDVMNAFDFIKNNKPNFVS